MRSLHAVPLFAVSSLFLVIALGCLGIGGGKDAEDTDTDTDTDADADTDTDTDADADADTDVVPPGDGVLLYTGDGGGGPGTDLYPSEVEAIFLDAGIPVMLSATLPGGWVEDYGALVLLNPTATLSGDVASGAASLLDRGGRLVIGFERSGWGNTTELNGLLSSLGSTMRAVGDQSSGGRAELSVQAAGGLTSGVGSLVTYYSASVDVGAEGAVSLGEDDQGVTVVGYEELGRGDVVIVADSSFFGYYLEQGDNTRFIENFAILR